MNKKTQFFTAKYEIVDLFNHSFTFAFDGNIDAFTKIIEEVLYKAAIYAESERVAFTDLLEYIEKNIPKGITLHSYKEDFGEVDSAIEIEQDDNKHRQN